MSRKSAAAAVVASNVVELESAAITAVKGIESSYGAASSAILAFVLACKSANVLPPVFEAGIARIAESSPRIAIVSVRGYVSNARRIWQCDADKLAEVMKTTNGLQSIAKACPAVSKNGGAGVSKNKKTGKGDETVPGDPKEPSAPVIKSAGNDPMAMIANALVELRKQHASTRRALSLIGEVEDILEELKIALTKAA